MLTKARKITSFLVGISALAIIAGSANALTTNAMADYVFSDAPGTFSSGAGVAGGGWTVGQNSASVGFVPGACVPPAAVAGVYAANATGAQVCTAGPAGPIAKTTAIGQSSLSVAAAATPAGLWPFTISTKGTSVVRSGVTAPRGDAKGTAKDPQDISSLGPGVYGFTITLGSGSSVFTDDPGGSATVHLDLGGPGISDLASIDLVANINGLDATVSFANDPLLDFFDPGTNAPITASQVEAILEGSSLNTLSGLSSQLPLFYYLVDLTGGLPPNPEFSADLTGIAVAVPEPGALGIILTGIIGLLGFGWRKQEA